MKIIKMSAILLGVALAAVLLYQGFAYASGMEKSLAGSMGAVAQAAPAHPGTGEGWDGSSEMLRWGVLLFAVGEFAGLIGMGVSNMRATRRQERARAQRELQPGPALQELGVLQYAKAAPQDKLAGAQAA